MARTIPASRIEPPPGPWGWTDALVLAAACTVLDGVRARPGSIAGMDREEFETWRAAMRLHRDAWRYWVHQAFGDAMSARDRMEEQGQAAGWWVDPQVPSAGAVPLFSADEAAEWLIEELGPDEAADWAWALARAARRKRRGVAA